MTIIVLAVVTLTAVVTALLLWRANRRKSANLALLLEALRNGDTSMRFRRNRRVNRTLNSIAAILGSMKRKAEQTDRYYGLILDQADTGIIVADTRGFVSTCNAAALRLLGLNVLTHMSQLSRVDPSLPAAVAAAEPGRRLTVGSGLGLTLHESVLRLDGNELRLFSLTDISHELEAREIAAWEQLTRTLAHEIMNTVAPVISLSETLLALPPQCDSEHREGLRAIGDTGRTLIKFVESYRSVAYAPKPDISRVDVSAVLRQAAALFPQVTWSATPGMTVMADPTMLRHILVNLCTNAIQAGARSITITASRDMIDVANDGEPIDSGLAPDIFTPFFSTRSDGSGIGLILSRRMMTSFGGSLTLLRHDRPVTFRLAFLRQSGPNLPS